VRPLRRNKQAIYALGALPVALLLAFVCFVALDDGPVSPEETSELATRRQQVAPAPPAAASEPAPGLDLRPAPPPPEPPPGPPPGVSFSEWRQRRVERLAYEQREQATAAYVAQHTKPTWVAQETYQTVEELRQLPDRLAAQRELAQRYAAVEPGTKAFERLYLADQQLALQAYELHRGYVEPNRAFAGQPVERARSLHPAVAAAQGRRARRAAKRARRAQRQGLN